MIRLLVARCIEEEDGAVAVDWVVLTAAVVGLAVAAYWTFSVNTADLVGTTASGIETHAAAMDGTIQDLRQRASGQ